ncbi:LysR family transcriptional regulator [Vibrio sp. 10N.286.49.C2]|uniref:LysR family transcriptional regulator n=1 Tax=unclassified Vibrio TaxID=2614977 RepID=UPI000C81E29A|nr:MULTISPECIES: LysR family transcriptional regulator [unclassified Vibrio]PMH31595.1 LysR family transcriptional regulator [Vibrio sp. 10N.286.49.C2]PMH50617.1 LysR family transcriptional regulator [Vibrio sp. 10N.286.49.B1]PMH82813.1 LysR family transcriptional regulator [Vibrio sp. 10N.286.48.B7]
MKLQFENIVSFVAVVNEGSFSSAARKLGKSQSTVSTAVQNLESDLGFELFNRQHAKISLTHKGKRLFHLSSPVIGKYKELVTAAKQMNISEQIVYRVGIDPLIFNDKAKQALLDFSEAFPNVDLHVVTKPSTILGNYLNEGKIDLALGNPYHKTNNDFNIEELYQANCWWVSHKDVPLDDKNTPVRVLLMDGADELLNFSSIVSHNLWRLDDLATIVDLCLAKKGIAFLPEHVLNESNRNKGLRVISDHPDFCGKKVVASLYWPVHSDFDLFNNWIQSQLKRRTTTPREFVADLTQ